MLSFVASAVQVAASPDKAACRAHAAQLVEQAARAGARLVALPELFVWAGPQKDELAQAEPIPGPTSRFAGELAARHGIYLVAGSVLERDASADKAFNTSLLFGPDGSLLARYRKIHLFDVDIESKVTARSRARAAVAATPCAYRRSWDESGWRSATTCAFRSCSAASPTPARR